MLNPFYKFGKASRLALEPIYNLKQIFLPRFKVLFSGSKHGIGLDIGSHSVKVVDVSRTGFLELVRFGIERFEKRSPLDSIRRLLEKANVHGREVNISVSGPLTVVRYIHLPLMREEEISRAIKFEAEKHIPFPMEEVLLDWQILNEEPQAKKIYLLLAAAKKDLIEEQSKLVESAGFIPQVIDIDALALINAFQRNISPGNEETVAILDIGAVKACVSILKGEYFYLTRDIILGGDEITRSLAKKFNLDTSEAEKLKCNPGEKSDEVLNAAQPALEVLLNELRLSFDYYESQFERSVDKVYLSGGSSNLKGLEVFLSQGLGVETQIFNPLRSLQINPQLNEVELSNVANQLGVAVGLALRR